MPAWRPKITTYPIGLGQEDKTLETLYDKDSIGRDEHDGRQVPATPAPSSKKKKRRWNR
jgi:hypothetical protein